jgi:diguanylate cyclase (GGDEF)-like protein|tara:strand:+ start:167 stop:1384 length:1218 start_codon:yes stop_codon:yes gene_type:complete
MGLGSLFVMLSAVDVGNGVLLDARVLLMGFAGLLAGWRGALAALMITLPARLLIGGAGAYIGCLTLLMAPLIGLAWRQFEARRSWGPSWRFLVFGALLQLSLGTIILFPEPQRTLALRDAVLPLLILNMIGALLAGWMELGINQSVVRAERWRRRALTDDLTGLGNRLQLTETIERKLQEIKQQGGSFALISLDLDNFRHINDTLGHKIGDAVLVAIARRLSDSLTPQDMLVRVAGDQFVVMMPSASANEIIQHARQLFSTAAAPLQIEHYVLLLTASIGVVWSPQNGAESRLLLQNAEIAMCRSKYRGRNQVTCFDDNMRTELERQTGLTQALRLALESKRDLRLVFQPQFSLVDRHLTGAEVLLRWRHPQLGDISPAEFVPLAEQAGLSGLLDRFVMEQTAIQ